MEKMLLHLFIISSDQHRLLLSSPVSLQYPAEIEGVVGGSVILPCSNKERELKPEEMNAFWRCNESKIVYNIEQGNFSTQGQDVMFKGRIESFPSEYMNGNFSIRLKHLNFTNGGQFSCFIPLVDEEYKLILIVRVSHGRKGRGSHVHKAPLMNACRLSFCMLITQKSHLFHSQRPASATLDDTRDLVSFDAAEDEVDDDNDAMSTTASGSGDWSGCQESEASHREVREPPASIDEELVKILSEAVQDLGLD
ncbi:V-set domain-containing T-cell activation inhibitor 1-like protein [Labeo rohita]|uniref:V-set domain-containing T-cell activation inhibitor 1-like protein n=1 Tax=Labeo rohita TaxID=84645 RepID=A0A498MBL4_LABRO|nr:V-set domain-containing T-cell activation inhibitor 1-like protein [Labeo rohita]